MKTNLTLFLGQSSEILEYLKKRKNSKLMLSTSSTSPSRIKRKMIAKLIGKGLKSASKKLKEKENNLRKKIEIFDNSTLPFDNFN